MFERFRRMADRKWFVAMLLLWPMNAAALAMPAAPPRADFVSGAATTQSVAPIKVLIQDRFSGRDPGRSDEWGPRRRSNDGPAQSGQERPHPQRPRGNRRPATPPNGRSTLTPHYERSHQKQPDFPWGKIERVLVVLGIGGGCAYAVHLTRRHRLKHQPHRPSVRVTLTRDGGSIRLICRRASPISGIRWGSRAYARRDQRVGDRAITDGESLTLKALLPATAVSACTTAAVRQSHLTGTRASVPFADALTTAVRGRVEELLDVPLLGALVDGLKDYRNGAGGADEALRLPLIDNALEASFESHLTIALSHLPTVRVSFEIAVEIEFEGIELVIKRHAVRAVRLGSCQAVVTVKCEGIEVFKHGSPKLELPGEFRLPEEIPLRSPYKKTVDADGWL
jgi:hypothetical protein